MEIFGIGGPEMLAIVVIALIALGPQRLPEVARTVGRAIYEFRKVSSEATSVFREVIDTTQYDVHGQRYSPGTGEPVQPDGLPYPMDSTGVHPMFRRGNDAFIPP